MGHLVIMDAIANPLKFGFGLKKLCENSQHGFE
jgi:hypothetical protein